MSAQRLKFAKYPCCFGERKLRDLCVVAQGLGMEVIAAYKPNMHVYNEIGLYGTRSQMKAVEAEWAKTGNTLKPRSFTAVFGVCLEIPREHWLPNPLPPQKKAA